MASDGVACRILNQNEQLEQMDTFPYLGRLGSCDYDGIPYQVKQGQAIGASLQKIWKIHSIPILTKTRLMKAPVWPVATYGCESWTLRIK